MSDRIGLVLEGGGVRGAFTAGALAWLNDNNITFDYNVGISSGAVCLACYLVHDNHTAHFMAVHVAPSKEFVGLRAFLKEGHYVAYGYLFDECLIGKEHMDIHELIESDIEMEVGLYDLGKGETVWIKAQDLDPDLVLLRASCALPVASAVVEYKGRRYLDGGITKMIPIERALEKGCAKCLVITTKPDDYVRKPGSPMVKAMMRVLYRDCPQIVKDYGIRHLNYYKQIGIVKHMVENGTCLYVNPTETIKASRWHIDSEGAQELYDLGYKDMERRREEILAFMEK